MKVIATSGRKKYICEVEHHELEKFLNLYYDKLPELAVGKEIDLGKGYDFAIEAKRACDKTADLIAANKNVIETILNGITFIGNIEPKEGES